MIVWWILQTKIWHWLLLFWFLFVLNEKKLTRRNCCYGTEWDEQPKRKTQVQCPTRTSLNSVREIMRAASTTAVCSFTIITYWVRWKRDGRVKGFFRCCIIKVAISLYELPVLLFVRGDMFLALHVALACFAICASQSNLYEGHTNTFYLLSRSNFSPSKLFPRCLLVW